MHVRVVRFTDVSAERMDGSVLLAGCDKSLPGMMMAMVRLNCPSIFIYGGSILPGCGRRCGSGLQGT